MAATTCGDGLAMARSADPCPTPPCVAYVYWPGIPLGVLSGPTMPALRDIEDALRIAERSGDDLALWPSPG